MKTIAVLIVAASIAPAQWLDFPTPGVPRLADGKPNLTAPAPKTADGKPDLSGIWVTKAGYTGNIARDLKPGELSFQPWASEVYKHRQETQGKDDPQAYCVLSGVPREHVVPYPFKILNTNGMIVILYEALHSYRQIYMDGRKLPKDPNPTWMGYSIGRWEGDTLVVESAGFKDGGWLDINGSPLTDQGRTIERFRRTNFGTIEIEQTIDDPKAYTRPFTTRLTWRLMPDTEIMEMVCLENNRSIDHIVRQDPVPAK